MTGDAAAVRLNDDQLARCIADPGSVVGWRGEDETVARWGVRAIRHLAAHMETAPGFTARAAAPEAGLAAAIEALMENAEEPTIYGNLAVPLSALRAALAATMESGKAGVSDAVTLAAEPGQSVVEPADRVKHPGTRTALAAARTQPEAADDTLVERIATVIVAHQRIPLYSPAAPGAQRCVGCDHLHGESDGPNSPRHAAHVAAAIVAALGDQS